MHAILAKEGVAVEVSDCFGVSGRVFLQKVPPGDAYRLRVDSLLHLIDTFSEQVNLFETKVADVLGDHPGYRAIQAIPGVGPVLAAIFVAEIGEITRLPGPDRLCSWAGLTRDIGSPTRT